jgi:hypothetical protein
MYESAGLGEMSRSFFYKCVSPLDLLDLSVSLSMNYILNN